MLLSNYVLSINLMLSIALKFSDQATFKDQHDLQLKELRKIEVKIGQEATDD